MNKKALASELVTTALFAAVCAYAASLIVISALSNFPSAFDNVITGTGSTVVTAQVVDGQSTYIYIDKDGNAATVSVTRTSTGAAALPSGGYNDYGTPLSGSVWNINPGSSVSGPIPGFGSGLTFAFSSAVNAFGFEIGDWATCCMS